MATELTHAEIIERLTTSFVVPFFQPDKGEHADWEDTTLTYRIDAAYTLDQRAAAREAFELWDDLIGTSLTETTNTDENIYFEQYASLGSLAKHVDPALWVAGGLAAALAGLSATAFAISAGAPVIFAGTAFVSAAQLTAGILAVVGAAGGFESVADMKVQFSAAFAPIKTDDWDFDGDNQTRIDWASAHIGNLTDQNGNALPLFNFVERGQPGFETFVHEIGHTLGLSHPGLYNGLEPSRDDPVVYEQDTHRFSIMSYFEETADGSATSWGGNRPSTPMLHDILAIQAKYGRDTTTRTGDTVYGFNSTAGRSVFDFTVNESPVLTIYDAGGIDALDTSGYDKDQVIDLRVNKVGQTLTEERFSSIGGLINNVAISYDVVIEHAVGGTAADEIFGNEAHNRLQGLAGNDTIHGGDGNDTLDGGTGADSMRGGSGNDIFVVDSTGDIVFEFANHGTDEIQTALTSFDLRNLPSDGRSVENLTYTGRFNFQGTGNNLLNVIKSDRGNDTLDGGVGADTLIGSAGNDTYIIDDARDRVTELAGEGTDTVRSRVSLTLFANTETLILEGTSTLNGTGNGLANSITGNAADNVLDGAGGADTLIGGAGNDTYRTDGLDTIVEALSSGTDKVISATGHTLAVNVENLSLTGTANATGRGNGSNNVIEGNAGSNQLFGASGNDTLTGSAGTDLFFFDTTLDPVKNVDTLADFSIVEDRIMLDNKLAFTALQTGSLLSQQFHIGSAAHDLDDRVIYNPSSGALIYDSNGSAAGSSVLFAILPTGLQLTRQSFEIYTTA